MTERFQARDEADLTHMIQEGLLEEDHHTELKREIPSGKGANKELGRDLASLAVDGGVLYVGVDEGVEGQPPSLHAVELPGLPERVDQVARSVIKPPLGLAVRTIATSASPGHGYVVVTVPPSGDAPHMVDGRYWGRGARTKESLADAQVRDILERRSRARDAALAGLRALVDRDPTPPQLRQQAHLFVLARPMFGPSDMLLRAFGDDSAAMWLTSQILQGTPLAEPSKGSPDLGSTATTVSRRARGWAIHTYEIGISRQLQALRDDAAPTESGLLDVEFDEDGTVQLFCGRASDGRNGARVVLDQLVIGLTKRVFRCAQVVADAAGYRGPWLLGLAVTNLRGAVSRHLTRSFTGIATAYSESDYFQTIEASYDELTANVDELVRRVYGRLDRALTGGRLL
jgi:hypothetical protein